jgi:predicted N-acetyltransferase YhbS
MVTIASERAGDGAAVEVLLDRAFGPERQRKTAQRLRDGQRPARGLALGARVGATVVGTVRFWPVRIGHRHQALLLGPVAVDAAYRRRGIGASLINAGLTRAKALGHRAVILVGDAPYYARFGFAAQHTAAMELPGPVDRARFLALELEAGALAGVAGLVAADAAIDTRALEPGRSTASRVKQRAALSRGDARVRCAA